MTRTPAQGALYFILADFGPKIGKAWVERDPKDMDRISTIIDIARGEWGSGVNVVQVLGGAILIYKRHPKHPRYEGRRANKADEAEETTKAKSKSSRSKSRSKSSRR